jgi:NAD(P)H-flavin reductase/hemoglobin-like flavoprotein
VASVQLARTESSARSEQPESPHGANSSFDRRPIRDLIAHLAGDPDGAMEYFFARLFAGHPDLRSLFPYSMTQTRAAVFGMLCALAGKLDDEQETARALAALAIDHRKFGVRVTHYRPFFDALVALAEHVAGPAWTAEAAVAWRSAVDYFDAVMVVAATDDTRSRPAWWTGEVVEHDRRTDRVAVLTIRPDQPLAYEPGQYIPVQVPRWPRTWRNYSIANAPRENGLIDIHVRAVRGGMVSTALVRHCSAGDTVLLGAARGEMRPPADPASGMVCIAGGTGLAPVKAITEAAVAAAQEGAPKPITLYFGARRTRDLYDMADLETLQHMYPSLTVIRVAERDLDIDGRVGRLPEVVKSHPSYLDCDVYVAGPAGLISATRRALGGRVRAERMHHDSIDALRFARRPDWEQVLASRAAETIARKPPVVPKPSASAESRHRR